VEHSYFILYLYLFGLFSDGSESLLKGNIPLRCGSGALIQNCRSERLMSDTLLLTPPRGESLSSINLDSSVLLFSAAGLVGSNPRARHHHRSHDSILSPSLTWCRHR
jgi:hypothetical protein